MADIVVVGAGMGGMAAAARLAARGHSVRVVEQSTTHGGKLGSYRRDGFVFDTGPSLLTLPAVYRDLFLKTATSRKNAALEDNVGLVGLDPAFAYRWADGASAVLPGSNPRKVADALGDALGGKTASEWLALSRRSGAIWAATRGPFLESPVDGPMKLMRQLGKFRDVQTIAPFTSLRRLGQQHLTDPRLRMYFERYATYAGSDPRNAPAALAVIPFVEQTFGAWHIEGGLAQLSAALYERCLQQNVTFNFGSAVSQVVVDGGRAVGVRLTDGQVLSANIVVSDADAGQLYNELIDDKSANRVRRRLNRVAPSVSGFVMLLALRDTTPAMQHHTILFPSDYDAEFDAIFGRNPRPVVDPAVYICRPGDRTMHPDGHESWFVLVNAPRNGPQRGVDWRAPGVADQYADHLLQVMADRGFDVRDRLLWREIRSPAWLEDASLTPGGSIYGTSSNGSRAAFLRPSNRSPIPGLFLVGGSAHPGGGLPLVGMSAAIVAELIGPA
ncbi:MAG TPA: phytoene desaturase family protein [Actinomycetes bacterium]|nr:phytoene desaturase family protein [Actinomycetes bacterium]